MKHPPASLAACAAACVSLLSIGCDQGESRAAWWQGEEQRISLSQELTLKQMRLDRAVDSGVSELARIHSGKKKTALYLHSLRSQAADLREEVASMEADLPAFKESLIRDQRQKAVGRKFEIFKTSNGRSYTAATVRSITDAGVAISHADGSARLSYDELDPAQRAMFGLDADRAQAARQEEERQVAAYERQMDIQLAAVREEEKEKAEYARAEAKAAREERLQIASRQASIAASVLANRPLAQPARSFGSYYSRRNYSGYYRPYRYRYYYYTPVRYYTPACYNSWTYPRGIVNTGRVIRNYSVTPSRVTPRNSFANSVLINSQ